jgi:hypothetical protein
VKNSSDASSIDMPNLVSMMAIRLLNGQRMINPNNGTYPPVPAPPIRSKCSQGSMILSGSFGYLSHWSLCIIAPMISNCDRPRAPPPSIGDACQKRRMNQKECEPKLASLSLLRGIGVLYSSLFRSTLVGGASRGIRPTLSLGVIVNQPFNAELRGQATRWSISNVVHKIRQAILDSSMGFWFSWEACEIQQTLWTYVHPLRKLVKYWLGTTRCSLRIALLFQVQIRLNTDGHVSKKSHLGGFSPSIVAKAH